MKYRIVKMENGSYRIQSSLLGLFWSFCAEPIAVYDKYKMTHVRGDGQYWIYENSSEAEEAINVMKENYVEYKNHYIDHIKVEGGMYKYFIMKGLFKNDYGLWGYDTLKEAKEAIDEKCRCEDNEKNGEKVASVVKTFQ